MKRHRIRPSDCDLPRSRCPSVPPSPERAAGRGFTLVEILVALSAGVLVSMAALSLSKNATNFFQHEARISAAQLALTLGMNRITADLTRASFLSSPNAPKDPMVCHDTVAWDAAAGLKSLAGVQITAQDVASPVPQSTANGMAPQQLVVGGSFDASDAFVVKCLNGGASYSLKLAHPNYDGALARLQASLPSGVTLADKLKTIFVGDRFVQILDPATGYKYFARVQDSNAAVQDDGTGYITIQLAAAPALPIKPASTCGLFEPKPSLCEKGLLVSAVSRVKYSIRKVTGGAYYSMVQQPAGIAAVTGDTDRTELVRVELGANNEDVEARREVVAEYAVDMRFGITVASKVPADDYNPLVDSYKLTDTANVEAIAGDVKNAGPTPQRIRAVQLRLATRTRAPDRTGALPTAGDGRKLRFLVGATLAPPYARVRTGYTNVSLPNQGGFSQW